jgi:dihydrofolate reductase
VNVDRTLRASVFIAASLDGYIARVDDGLDWLPEDAEEHGYEAFMASVDALVIGRRTFETVLGFDAWPYGAKPVFVLSTHELAPGAPADAIVQRMAGDPAAIASQLVARGIGHVYVDGGITIQRFLKSGLLQRLVLTRIPVLLGGGIPLFGALDHDVRLRHVSTRSFESGMVQSEYLLGE